MSINTIQNRNMMGMFEPNIEIEFNTETQLTTPSLLKSKFVNNGFVVKNFKVSNNKTKTKVKTNNNIVTLALDSFRDNKELKTITVGDDITFIIGQNSLYASNLERINATNVTVASNYSGLSNTNIKTIKPWCYNMTGLLPTQFLTSLQADGLSEDDKIEFPLVTSIGGGFLFDNLPNQNITEVYLPNVLTQSLDFGTFSRNTPNFRLVDMRRFVNPFPNNNFFSTLTQNCVLRLDIANKEDVNGIRKYFLRHGIAIGTNIIVELYRNGEFVEILEPIPSNLTIGFVTIGIVGFINTLKRMDGTPTTNFDYLSRFDGEVIDNVQYQAVNIMLDEVSLNYHATYTNQMTIVIDPLKKIKKVGNGGLRSGNLRSVDIKGCKQLGDSSDLNDVFLNVRQYIPIHINNELSSNYNGDIDRDLYYAMVERGADIFFYDDNGDLVTEFKYPNNVTIKGVDLNTKQEIATKLSLTGNISSLNKVDDVVSFTVHKDYNLPNSVFKNDLTIKEYIDTSGKLKGISGVMRELFNGALNLEKFECDSIQYLNNYVFQNTKITNLYLPSLIWIGAYCFNNMPFVTRIECPILETPSETNAQVASCPMLEEFVAPLLKGINEGFYQYNVSLKRAIHNEATYIKQRAFFRCLEIDLIEVKKCKSIGDNLTITNAFSDIKMGCEIHVNIALKTIFNGGLNPDLAYAKNTRGAIIHFYDDNLNLIETI